MHRHRHVQRRRQGRPAEVRGAAWLSHAGLGLRRGPTCAATSTVLLPLTPARVTTLLPHSGKLARRTPLPPRPVVCGLSYVSLPQLRRSLGCHRVVNYRQESLKEVLKREFPRGLDLVYESGEGACAAAAVVVGRESCAGRRPWVGCSACKGRACTAVCVSCLSVLLNSEWHRCSTSSDT